jgi:UTP--glucose-1-phosphate uridylyltransferase
MITNIKKAIIPITETDENFFPLTRCVAKELLPIGDAPLIQRVVDEAIECGVEKIVFIVSSEKKAVINHFLGLENVEDVTFQEKYSSVLFSALSQKKKSESGYTVFRAKDETSEDAFILSFPEVVFSGKKSSLEQLFSVYRTSQKSVAGIRKVSDEEVSMFDIVETEKIANSFYKIKKVIKNPKKEETKSRLALTGRFIFTPMVFDYLKNAGVKTSIADVINEMLGAGKTVYGHECEGEWFSIKDKKSFLSAQEFFLNNHF